MSGTSYEERVVSSEEEKEALPFGTLPALQLDGSIASRPIAILRYACSLNDRCASRTKTPESLDMEQWIDLHADFVSPILLNANQQQYGPGVTVDKTAHTDWLVEEHIPHHLRLLERELQTCKYLAGGGNGRDDAQGFADILWSHTLKKVVRTFNVEVVNTYPRILYVTLLALSSIASGGLLYVALTQTPATTLPSWGSKEVSKWILVAGLSSSSALQAGSAILFQTLKVSLQRMKNLPLNLARTIWSSLSFACFFAPLLSLDAAILSITMVTVGSSSYYLSELLSRPALAADAYTKEVWERSLPLVVSSPLIVMPLVFILLKSQTVSTIVYCSLSLLQILVGSGVAFLRPSSYFRLQLAQLSILTAQQICLVLLSYFV